MNKDIQRAQISIRGIVQGVGFRPFVFNLAMSMGMNGYVLNSSNGVIIDIEGRHIDTFIKNVLSSPPILARIKDFEVVTLQPLGYENFTIKESLNDKGITLIPPDISICNDCLKEIFDSRDRRYLYPFTNCTDCGPRYTIINDIPYDRKNTTMASFIMCPECEREYHTHGNRRFHAQPNACANCGPQITLRVTRHVLREKKEDSDETDIILSGAKAIKETVNLLKQGAIVAIKGIGGFHLCCDATNENAVSRLRERKRKSNKPFALMAPDIETIKKFCAVDESEIKTLLSFERPIVLLEKIKNNLIAPSVAPNNKRYGAMLPYTPLHYLLFFYPFTSHLSLLTSHFLALVMTSGNLSEEPIVVDNGIALERLKDIADAFLINNRDIYMRTDDSVCIVIKGRPRLVRRSRGYAPMPAEMLYDSPEIIAVGGELKNTFTITKDKYAILSQHIGDVENHETMEFFEETLKNLKKIYKVEPIAVTHDLHPNYLTTRWAINSGLKTIPVQHHHAHIASCMLDNGIDDDVIGISFDGTGYGTDGKIWGGEFMIANLERFIRKGHFKYVLMPGGDMAVKEPWRMAVSYIIDAFGSNYENVFELLGFFEKYGERNIKNIITMIKKQINTYLTSSAGRLFDVLSAMIGLCDRVTFEAEAAISLEAICDEMVFDSYPVNIIDSAPMTVDFSPMIISIVKDINDKLPRNIIASKFHNTISEIIGRVVEKISLSSGIKKVALSGGVFQNRFLLQRALMNLREGGFDVYIHERVPTNDGGISLGQAAIAAKRLSQKIQWGGNEGVGGSKTGLIYWKQVTISFSAVSLPFLAFTFFVSCLSFILVNISFML